MYPDYPCGNHKVHACLHFVCHHPQPIRTMTSWDGHVVGQDPREMMSYMSRPSHRECPGSQVSNCMKCNTRYTYRIGYSTCNVHHECRNWSSVIIPTKPDRSRSHGFHEVEIMTWWISRSGPQVQISRYPGIYRYEWNHPFVQSHHILCGICTVMTPWSTHINTEEHEVWHVWVAMARPWSDCSHLPPDPMDPGCDGMVRNGEIP